MQTWQFSTWELGYVNFAFCQCGVGKEEKCSWQNTGALGIPYSCSTQCVFSPGSRWCSYCVLKFPCVPQSVLNIVMVYPIFITQNSTFVTHIVRSKEKAYSIFYFGSVHSVSDFFCLRWIKETHCPQKRKDYFGYTLKATNYFLIQLLVAYLRLRWPMNSK
jgi:hypothetical protein